MMEETENFQGNNARWVTVILIRNSILTIGKTINNMALNKRAKHLTILAFQYKVFMSRLSPIFKTELLIPASTHLTLDHHNLFRTTWLVRFGNSFTHARLSRTATD